MCILTHVYTHMCKYFCKYPFYIYEVKHELLMFPILFDYHKDHSSFLSLLLFSCSAVSSSLLPHGLQHTRLHSPSPSPGACSNSCPSSRWYIQPSHPLLSPCPPAFNLSQNQGPFQWVSSLHQVAKLLEFQLQHQSFQWIFKTDFL